MNGLVR